MDPEVIHKALRGLSAEILLAHDDIGGKEINYDWRGRACELAEMYRAMDRWIRKGGFLPEEWNTVIRSPNHPTLQWPAPEDDG